MAAKIFIVTDNEGIQRLVEAQNASDALRHVVGTKFTCELAKGIDVVNLMREKNIHPEVAVSTRKSKAGEPADSQAPSLDGANEPVASITGNDAPRNENSGNESSEMEAVIDSNAAS